jgi:hypothetical protein
MHVDGSKQGKKSMRISPVHPTTANTNLNGQIPQASALRSIEENVKWVLAHHLNLP